MSEQKRYTAEEMREAAGQVVSELYTNPFADMLRQAADAEEENAKLKARLEAVMKYAKENTWDESGEKNAYLDTTTRIHNHDMRAILRAACGEGGTE